MVEELRELGRSSGGYDYTDTVLEYANEHSEDEKYDLSDLVREYDILSDAFTEKGFIGFDDFFEFKEEYNGEKA